MIRVFVATPSQGTIADAQPFVLRDLAALYADSIELVYPEHCVQRRWYDFARNGMVKEFLASGCDILWFLDSDVVPPRDVLDIVADHHTEWKVAGAPYPIFVTQPLTGERELVFAVYDGHKGGGLAPCPIPGSGTAFVDGVATGCMFIKREVLEHMAQPYFEFKFDPTTRHPDQGEDIGFCLKLKAQGIRFFVDYAKVCSHHKEVDLLEANNYAINFARRSVESYDAEIKEKVRAAIRAAYQKGFKDGVSSGVTAPTTKESGTDGPNPRVSSKLILPPGFGSLSHK